MLDIMLPLILRQKTTETQREITSEIEKCIPSISFGDERDHDDVLPCWSV